MPDASGRLTSHEKLQIIKWAKRVAPNGFLCPITGDIDPKWTLSDFAVSPLRVDHLGRFVPGPGAMPLQFIFLNTKGCMLHFSVEETGINLEIALG